MEEVDLRNNHLSNLMVNKGIKFAFMGVEHWIRSTSGDRIIYTKDSVQFKEGREATRIAERLIRNGRLPFTDGEYDYHYEEGTWYRTPKELN